MYQCEGLLTTSGCVILVILTNKTFRIKDYGKDFYMSALSYWHFDQMYSKQKKYIDIEMGSNARILDIECAFDVNSHFKINPLGMVIKRFSFKS